MTTSIHQTTENVNTKEDTSILMNTCNELNAATNSKSLKSKSLQKPLNNQLTDHLYRSSSSSVNSSFKMSSASVDDDDERFYDAIDAAETFSPSSNTISNKMYSFEINQNEGAENENDEEVPCFFDTKTSRHASELSDCSVVGSLPSFRNKPSILVEDNQKSEFSSRNLKKNYSDKEINDEDDEYDVELETEWSFWIDRCIRGTTKEEYEAGLKLIHSFKTVQTFWSIFNNIPDISKLPNSFSYHLMRNSPRGVRRPLWEDMENRRGGQWKLKCKKDETSLVWQELLLAGIGEQFSDYVSPLDDIVGLTVGKRDKEDIIQIWNLDHTYNTSARVCERLQELVPDVKFSTIFYKQHASHEAFEGNQPSTLPHSNNYTNNNQKNYVNNSFSSHNSNINNTNQYQHPNLNGNKKYK